MILLFLAVHLARRSLGPHDAATRVAVRDTTDDTPEDSDYRSTVDILWTCLFTIFACTWISVHPNVAGYRSTWRQTFAARLELMVWAIFAPELIVVFAFRQWNGARTIRRKMNDLAEMLGSGKRPMPWTETHGHLLQMGGIMVRERDGCCHYLDVSALLSDREEVHSVARIQFNSGSTWSSVSRIAGQETVSTIHPTHVHPSSNDPASPVPPPPPSTRSFVGIPHLESSEHVQALLNANIPESDIWDKSKGDAFAKAFALLQTGW
ncbi:hypothetical protein NMY22_g5561 [Coprinellus aureogranulatus]|nr:hypothetical protein NMY22_g5561 [Coprinellus aureogranulatus]